jgi:hypothetical protein
VERLYGMDPISPKDRESPYLVANQRGELDLHLIWARMVADIPALCRELVAALAEEGIGTPVDTPM